MFVLIWQWIVNKCLPFALAKSWAAALNSWKLGFHPDSRGCWASSTLNLLPCVLPAQHVPCELWLGSKQSEQQQPGLWCHLHEQQLCSLSFCRWEEVVSKPHSPNSPALRWRRLALVGKPRLENAVEEKYLTKNKTTFAQGQTRLQFLFSDTKPSYIWFQFHSTHPAVLWMACKCEMFHSYYLCTFVGWYTLHFFKAPVWDMALNRIEI